MNPDFQAAAVSYFGLPEGTTVIPSDPGYLAFHVVLDADTLRGIADRMKALSVSPPVLEVPPSFCEGLSQDEMRERYNAMGAADKAKYGSFARYVAGQYDLSVSEGVGGRQVVHVDAPVEAEEQALPKAVWVPTSGLSREQKLMGSDHDSCYTLIQVAMLDDAQRAKYAPDTAKITIEPGVVLVPRSDGSKARPA